MNEYLKEANFGFFNTICKSESFLAALENKIERSKEEKREKLINDFCEFHGIYVGSRNKLIKDLRDIEK